MGFSLRSLGPLTRLLKPSKVYKEHFTPFALNVIVPVEPASENSKGSPVKSIVMNISS